MSGDDLEDSEVVPTPFSPSSFQTDQPSSHWADELELLASSCAEFVPEKIVCGLPQHRRRERLRGHGRGGIPLTEGGNEGGDGVDDGGNDAGNNNGQQSGRGYRSPSR